MLRNQETPWRALEMEKMIWLRIQVGNTWFVVTSKCNNKELWTQNPPGMVCWHPQKTTPFREVIYHHLSTNVDSYREEKLHGISHTQEGTCKRHAGLWLVSWISCMVESICTGCVFNIFQPSANCWKHGDLRKNHHRMDVSASPSSPANCHENSSPSCQDGNGRIILWGKSGFFSPFFHEKSSF